MRCAGEPGVEEALQLTRELVPMREKETAQARLYEALLKGERKGESVAYAKALGGEFWRKYGEGLESRASEEKNVTDLERRKVKMDPSVIGGLVKRLEEKLLPVPGTEVLLSKTELTVGEWKLYLRAEGYLTPEGLPDWKQPSRDFEQTDEHPVVNVNWNEAMRFCEWLREKTGREWRLPTNAEWEAAVGPAEYPWGAYYPPKWDDGNYAVSESGRNDLQKVGVDGIKGTAPVASFKPNALGFYDLGGNVWEWVMDGWDEKNVRRVFCGGCWLDLAAYCRAANRRRVEPGFRADYLGLRPALVPSR